MNKFLTDDHVLPRPVSVCQNTRMQNPARL